MAPGDDHGEHFSDNELADALADARDREISSPSAALLGDRPSQKSAHHRVSPSHSRRRKPSRPRWMTQASPRGYDLDDRDEDVPLSLLVEGNDDDDLKSRLPPPPHSMPSRSRTPSPQPSPHRNRLRWEDDRAGSSAGHPVGRWLLGRQHPSLANIDPKQKAMWRWANVENLDNFLKDVYAYFLGRGLWSILLYRALSLLYVLWTAGSVPMKWRTDSCTVPLRSLWASRHF